MRDNAQSHAAKSHMLSHMLQRELNEDYWAKICLKNGLKLSCYDLHFRWVWTQLIYIVGHIIKRQVYASGRQFSKETGVMGWNLNNFEQHLYTKNVETTGFNT